MKAMVLAAGRGERMRPLTDALPKPLLQVSGRALVEHHLEALARAGITQIVMNTSWLGHLIRDRLGDGSGFGVHIDYSDEQPAPLGTGGGIFRALGLLGNGPFVVVNADVYCEFDFSCLRLGQGDLAQLVMVPNPSHHPAGDFYLRAGRVMAHSESRDDDTLTFSGISLLHPDLFLGCRDGAFGLAPLLRKAMSAGRVGGMLFEGSWSDVGTPDRLRALSRPAGQD